MGKCRANKNWNRFSDPIPKFVSLRGTFRSGLRTQKDHQQLYDSGAVLNFEVPMAIIPPQLTGTTNSPH
jgi:hypothetical protein